jgi:hypothetical protein
MIKDYIEKENNRNTFKVKLLKIKWKILVLHVFSFYLKLLMVIIKTF